MNKTKQKVSELLALADVQINGSRPWDIQVHDERLYGRVLSAGGLGFGEAYMDGWWDSDSVDGLVFRLIHAKLENKVSRLSLLLPFLISKVQNRQSKSRAFEVGEKHYNIGNDLFENMLDKRMTYTCAYWKDLDWTPENLDMAQEQKLDLVCRKIGLKKGDHILDIGCGWGSFAKFAVEKYGARVTGINNSTEQEASIQKRLTGLPIEVKVMDYRELTGSYDHVVSLGMFEHVGNKNYRTYFDVVNRVLKKDGFFLLHTIGHNRHTSGVDPWIEKYIFPNGIIPQSSKVCKAFEGIFVAEDWQNFGQHYDPTLLAWFDRFEKSWQTLKETGKYSGRFYRMWKYYLLACAGAFRSRNIQLWQITFSKSRLEKFIGVR